MKDTVHTIADIARLAGVSKSTVSRALNDSPLIGTETKDRVRAIAEEHGFQMSAPARRLSLKQSSTIALVSYRYNPSAQVADTFMLEVMSGISSALHEESYDLLLTHVDSDDTEWGRAYLESGRAAGFVLFSAMCTQRQIATLVDLEAPFIVWGAPPGGRGCCSVSGDSLNGGRLATDRLIGIGRNRIAFLGGPRGELEVQDRHRGYEAAFEEAGRDVDEALVSYGKWSEASAAERMLTLLTEHPDVDGVFASSDVMAIAAMDILREHGRRIPDDVAVVGYDDVTVARYSNPPLTTIRQSAALAGRLMAQNLVQHLRTGVVTNVTIPAELIVRESA